MSRLAYRISPEIFALCPGYVRGVLVFDDLDNSAKAPQTATLLEAAQQNSRGASEGNVAEIPRIAAWRNAYRRFGAKPSEHRSSIESLLRRAQKPDPLPAINTLVDIGNIVSLQHGLPAGMHPLPHADADIELRIARPGDSFLPPDAQSPETVAAPEVVLATRSTVLTRRWTWRQSASTLILPGTTRAFLNVDGLPPISAADVDAAMRDAAALVQRFCGGDLVASILLTADNPCATVAFRDV